MPSLTIGLPTYDDYDGVYFTVQALRLYQDLADTEILVIDNFGCPSTRRFVEGIHDARYVLLADPVGSAAAKDVVFRQARSDAVLCLDCHVLLVAGAITKLRQFYVHHRDCVDLVQGPLLYDDGRAIATHQEPRWSGQMLGVWANDPRGLDPDAPPFEIPMQGLGLFSCRKAAWPGFSAGFRGFGGEEGYLHEKIRRAGGRCLCLPALRWMHRFERPHGAPYPLSFNDKVRNYAIGFAELGLDLRPVVQHFAQYAPTPDVIEIIEQALGVRWIAA